MLAEKAHLRKENLVTFLDLCPQMGSHAQIWAENWLFLILNQKQSLWNSIESFKSSDYSYITIFKIGAKITE